MKIVLADILYTNTDQTYYVLNGKSRHTDLLCIEALDALWKARLELTRKGWEACGQVVRWDDQAVAAFTKHDEYIAVWKEDEGMVHEVESENQGLSIDDMNAAHFQYQAKPVMKKNSSLQSEHMIFARRNEVVEHALHLADFTCEIDKQHKTFLRKKDHLPYMEAHHLVPMKYAEYFAVSLDVEENVVSLCTNCHHLLHYGEGADGLLKMLFQQRKEHLQAVGISITLEDLLEMYHVMP